MEATLSTAFSFVIRHPFCPITRICVVSCIFKYSHHHITSSLKSKETDSSIFPREGKTETQYTTTYYLLKNWDNLMPLVFKIWFMYTVLKISLEHAGVYFLYIHVILVSSKNKPKFPLAEAHTHTLSWPQSDVNDKQHEYGIFSTIQSQWARYIFWKNVRC